MHNDRSAMKINGTNIRIYERRGYTEFVASEGVKACLINDMNKLNIVCNGQIVNAIVYEDSVLFDQVINDVKRLIA